MTDDLDEDGPVGWGKPPRSHQFTPQHQRSRGRRRRRGPPPLPHEAVLGQLVPSRNRDGTECEMPLDRFIWRHLQQLSLQGRMAAYEQLLRARAELRRRLPDVDEDDTDYVILNNFVGSVNDSVLGLAMARKIDPDGPDPIILLEPWLVQLALARLDRELTVEEQRIVWEATLTPKRVCWPDWWTERRPTRRPKRKRPLLDEGVFYPPCVMEGRSIEPE